MEKGATLRERRGLAPRALTAVEPDTAYLELPGPRLGWFAGCVLLTTFLFTFAFPPFALAEGAYVFALPVFLWALLCRPVKGEGWVLFAGGWLAWAILLSWLQNVTSHLSIPLTGVLGGILVLALSGAVAFFWWMGVYLGMRLMRSVRQAPLLERGLVLVLIGALWILLEWVRSWILTGFPWLPLAASQWQRPLLLQVISLTGSSGLAFVLIAFNAGLAFYLQNLWRFRKAKWWRRLSPEFYLALSVLFMAIGFGLQTGGMDRRERIEGPRVGFVQPNMGAFEKWTSGMLQDNLKTLYDLSLYAGYLDAELVLWPESPTPTPILGNDGMQAWIEALVRASGRPFLVGNIALVERPSAGKALYHNGVFALHPETGLQSDRYYAKRRLVPFGEYVPLARFLPFIDKLGGEAGDFIPGSGVQLLRDPMDNRVGALVCYEDVFPKLARETVAAGADWLFVVTNTAWFGERGAAVQHAAHSVLRAVETRRPVVRSGNSGWSGWIDEYGHIRHVMRDDTGSIYFQGVDVTQLSLSTYWSGRRSHYVRHGDWLVLASAVVFLSGLVLLALRNRLPGR